MNPACAESVLPSWIDTQCTYNVCIQCRMQHQALNALLMQQGELASGRCALDSSYRGLVQDMSCNWYRSLPGIALQHVESGLVRCWRLSCSAYGLLAGLCPTLINPNIIDDAILDPMVRLSVEPCKFADNHMSCQCM